MKKLPEYRGMGDEQLGLTLKEMTRNLFHLRFQSATERLETPSQIQKAKREIARILTIQRERSLAQERAAAAAKPAPAPKAAEAPKPAASPKPTPAAKASAPKKPAAASKPAAKKEK